MDHFMAHVTAEERAFYGSNLVLLEGIILEFLSCLEMIRRYQTSLGRSDPVSSHQARIKQAASMREKLRRQGLPVTAESALREVRDAAGVRLICPFVDDIYRTAGLIQAIPGIRIDREKDYIRDPKPNGYRSYHLVLSLPLRFLPGPPAEPVWLEVQLRTIAMDSWATLEHQLRYKSKGTVSAEVANDLVKCSEMLFASDLKMQQIAETLGVFEQISRGPESIKFFR